jgi:hypothetical protein
MTFILNSTRLLLGFKRGAPAVQTSMKTEEKLLARAA